MRTLGELFENNRQWAERVEREDPGFFPALAQQQSPHYLWIGCADSRVPANEIVDLLPGELFVHRNIANVVVHSDLNCLSVIQFAVDVLQVRHIIVCGHYGCGGVSAALQRERHGLVDNWLRHVQDVGSKYAREIEAAPEACRFPRFCELNVIEQVLNVCQTTVVGDAWARGQQVNVHGWIYGVHNGRLRDLKATVTNAAEVLPVYASAVAAIDWQTSPPGVNQAASYGR